MSVYFMGSDCGEFAKLGHHNLLVPAARYIEHRRDGIRNLRFNRALAHVHGTKADEDNLKKYFKPFTTARYGSEIVPIEHIVGYITWLRMQYFSREDQAGLEVPDVVQYSEWCPNSDRVSTLRREIDLYVEDDVWGFLPEKLDDPEGEEAFYAPPPYVDSVREFFGGTIDLDPCSHQIPQRYICARTFYTRAVNGLTLQWFGKVWGNFPFHEDECRAFLNKAMLEVRSGRVEELITLVEVTKPSNEYFIPFMQCFVSAVCLIQGRDKWKGMGTSNGPRRPYILLYTGTRVDEFVRHFSAIGFAYKK